MPPPAKQINQLAILAKSAPAANQPKIHNIIDLYTTRKVPMFSTALNVVTALASKHKATISSGKAIRLYDEVIAKYSPNFTIKPGNHFPISNSILPKTTNGTRAKMNLTDEHSTKSSIH